MMINMPEFRVKRSAKRLRKIMRNLGVEASYMECLELSTHLFGFQSWQDYRCRDLFAPLSPFDEQLTDEEFSARDDFQMNILAKVGLGSIARELLDSVNPTGSWRRKPTESEDDGPLSP